MSYNDQSNTEFNGTSTICQTILFSGKWTVLTSTTIPVCFESIVVAPMDSRPTYNDYKSQQCGVAATPQIYTKCLFVLSRCQLFMQTTYI